MPYLNIKLKDDGVDDEFDYIFPSGFTYAVTFNGLKELKHYIRNKIFYFMEREIKKGTGIERIYVRIHLSAKTAVPVTIAIIKAMEFFTTTGYSFVYNYGDGLAYEYGMRAEKYPKGRSNDKRYEV